MQITKVSFTCISHEENGENHAQSEQLRRSGDAGDICSQHIIVINVITTKFLILWYMITNVSFLQLFAFWIFPVCIIVGPMLLFTDLLSTLNVFLSELSKSGIINFAQVGDTVHSITFVHLFSFFVH